MVEAATARRPSFLTIEGEYDPPTANPDTATVSEDGPGVTIDPRPNDRNPDSGSIITVTGVDDSSTTGTATSTSTEVTYDPDGHYEYLALGETAVDTVDYTITDGINQSTARISVTIEGANDAPAAADDTASVPEDGRQPASTCYRTMPTPTHQTRSRLTLSRSLQGSAHRASQATS
ncbi:MAG: Ig-like domain-containing protein [Acidimicrobiales bacterium]